MTEGLVRGHIERLIGNDHVHVLIRYIKRYITGCKLFGRELFEGRLVDVLHGYPRAKGIEIATRTLSPEVIFCDEIGSAEEARAILGAQNSGVPLIATAHAESREALLRRPSIRLLYENHIFRYYIGLRRKPGARAFDFDVFDTAAVLV